MDESKTTMELLMDAQARIHELENQHLGDTHVIRHKMKLILDLAEHGKKLEKRVGELESDLDNLSAMLEREKLSEYSRGVADTEAERDAAKRVLFESLEIENNPAFSPFQGWKAVQYTVELVVSATQCALRDKYNRLVRNGH